MSRWPLYVFLAALALSGYGAYGSGAFAEACLVVGGVITLAGALAGIGGYLRYLWPLP